MRKAVRLRVTLYVRGEDEPAHDFARSAARAVREVIAAGRGAHPELRISVRRIVEDDTEDLEDRDDGDDDDGSAANEARDGGTDEDSGQSRRAERDAKADGESDSR